MSNFDPFRFVDERQTGQQVSEADCNEFQMFTACRYLSMNPALRRYVEVLNDLQFQKLPKDLQARAFNAFNGANLNLRWTRAKTAVVREKDEFIDHMMKITGMSRNCAKAAIRYGFVDKDEIEEAYMRKYEPEKMIARMQGEERQIKRNIKKAANLK